MLALSGFVLATVLFSSPTAYAGSWSFHITDANAGSTNSTIYTDTATPAYPGYPGHPGPPAQTNHTTATWTPPADSTNKATISNVGISASISGSGATCNASMSITATIKATWVPDPSLPTDPPPPSVKIIEIAGAHRTGINGDGSPANGSVSNGLDPASTSAASVLTPQTDASGKALVPPVHLTMESGASWTLTRTFSVSINCTNGTTNGTNGTLYAAVNLDNYTVSIHAQPYNFRSSGYTKPDSTHANKISQDNANAILALSYVWDSTDGIKADLGSCQIKENVTWDTNTVGQVVTNPDGSKVYVPPSPPVGVGPDKISLAYPDPTITQQPATNPGITDTFSPEAYFTGAPYRNISWWGDQVYVFSDSATDEKVTPIPGPAAGSARITRTVAPIANTTTFGYTISTRGYSAGPMTLPGQ